MAQRRNSSGRSDERSDLDDTKALAARARSNTGGPVAAPNPSELSGVRPRRDSVIGARLTPPPRATSGELPNWFFGTLGFLTVLLVGFGGLFVLGRSGKLDALMGEGGPLATSPAPAAPVVEPEAPPAAAPAAPAPTPAEPAPAPAVAERARVKEPVAENPPADEPRAEHSSGSKHERVAAAAPSKSRAAKPADPGTAEPGEEQGDEAPAAPAAPAKSARAAATVAAAPNPAEPDEADEDQSAPGQDAVEAALDALATKVRGCFVKYQIKGTARVRLVATPSGSAESVNVTGDFEDTPTGMCVEAVVSSAKLPAFKGPPLKLSQSYQLR
jgi:outer membrane biosynthesis protein TonB